jgi:hypothetical protein
MTGNDEQKDGAFTLSAQEQETVARAMKHFAKMQTAPRAGADFQARVDSEMGLEKPETAPSGDEPA